eukprot:GILK01004282.1.p1 GENE.GILK01004282.1~~GILK01004282.1.p1  ORF type:complete len:245 (-),score=19.38 GILK01004282.1:305-1039(-)
MEEPDRTETVIPHRSPRDLVATEESTHITKHTKQRRKKKPRSKRGRSVPPVNTYAAVEQLYSSLLPPLKLSHAVRTVSVPPYRRPHQTKRADHKMPPISLHLPSPSSMHIHMHIPEPLSNSKPHSSRKTTKHVDLLSTPSAVDSRDGMLSAEELHDLGADGTVSRYVSPLTTPNRLISYIEHLREKENERIARSQMSQPTRHLRSVMDIKKSQQVEQVYGHIPNTLRSFAQEDLRRSRRQQACR